MADDNQRVRRCPAFDDERGRAVMIILGGSGHVMRLGEALDLAEEIRLAVEAADLEPLLDDQVPAVEGKVG